MSWPWPKISSIAGICKAKLLVNPSKEAGRSDDKHIR